MILKKNKKEAIAAELYTKEYFLEDCGGYGDYLAEGGKTLPERLQSCLDIAGIKSGMKVLDIGCGRGELVVRAAFLGADVKGIDYSEAALELAGKIVPDDLKEKVSFACADVKKLSEPDNFYDCVLITDVVEHLHDWELNLMFASVYKMLKKDGRVIIHTSPNKNLYNLANPIMRFFGVLSGIKIPRLTRTKYEKMVHINEQTMGSLNSLLKQNGFETKQRFADFEFWRGMFQGSRFFHFLESLPVFKFSFAKSLLVVAYKNVETAQNDLPRLYEAEIRNPFIFKNGFYLLEDNSWRWSEKKSEIEVYADKKLLQCTLNFLKSDQIKNDFLLVETNFGFKQKFLIEEECLSLKIPLKMNNINVIKFETANYFQPSQQGWSSDNRRLSFRISNLATIE